MSPGDAGGLPASWPVLPVRRVVFPHQVISFLIGRPHSVALIDSMLHRLHMRPGRLSAAERSSANALLCVALESEEMGARDGGGGGGGAGVGGGGAAGGGARALAPRPNHQRIDARTPANTRANTDANTDASTDGETRPSKSPPTAATPSKVFPATLSEITRGGASKEGGSRHTPLPPLPTNPPLPCPITWLDMA